MFRMLNAAGLSLALGLAAVLPAAAQTADDTATPEAEAPATDVEAQAEGAGGLSLGEPVATEPQVGQPYVVETFTAWELRCVKAPEGEDPCQLYQLLRDEGGNAVAEFTIFPLPEGGQAAAGATVITPLETLLTAQLRLSVDGGQARRYPFAFCSTIGCFSRMGFTADEIAQFKAGSAATVAINPAAAPDETVDLSLSLSGFTAGFEALQDRLAAE